VLVYSAVDQTKMYMVTVAEYLGNRAAYAGTTVRIAGRVRADSMQWDTATRELRFTLDDIAAQGSVPIHYTGLLPDMFAEGRDVVVEGPHGDGETFEADTILTSCPSKYAPE
jgi:cytochrome c-type biogenesis protein CcmE